MTHFILSCGTVALVDADLVSELLAHKWHLSSAGYAVRTVNSNEKVLMHRQIIQAGSAEAVDHVNGNRLDNRLENLRIAKSWENSSNLRKRTETLSSQFKGVTWNKKCNKWQAQIEHKRHKYYLGVFDCEHSAAHAYNKKAIEFCGEYACLNPVGFK